MRIFLAFTLVVIISLIAHFKTAEHTPSMEAVSTAIEDMNEIVFGGVLANEVAVDTTVETTNTATEISSPGLVWTSDTNGYIFYEDSGGGLSMSSTTNSGATWSAARNVDSVNTTDVVSFGVWWEGWTPGTTTTRYIHIVTTDLGVDDTYYTRLDTQTGALTATVLGTTQAATCTDGSSCYASITMTATGTLMMTAADGSDSWVVRCGQYLGCSTGSNWNESTGAYASPLADHWPLLAPIPGTDNIMLINGDRSSITTRYNIYSATSSTWWGTATLSSATIPTNLTYDTQLLGATISKTTGMIYATITSGINDYTTADHDINIWSFSTTTWSWTQQTDCTTNYTGGVIGAKLAYDETNDTLYCIMGLRSTIDTATTGGIYYKTSTDGGTTWSATSTSVNDNADDINGMTVNIIGTERIGVTWNYFSLPSEDDQYYDDIADLIADGGGGGGSTPQQYNVIWLD